MDERVLKQHLERHGVVVHHVGRRETRNPAVDPPGPAGPGAEREGVLVVFLEGARGQHEQARTLALQCDGVTAVYFHPGTRAIMYVRGQP